MAESNAIFINIRASDVRGRSFRLAEEWMSLLMPPDGRRLMIALVGAGGKTTTMMALAKAYAGKGYRVLITTTTRIYVPSEGDRDHLIIKGEPFVPEQMPARGTVTVMGSAVEENGKLVGLSPDQANRLFQEGGFDILLIEADGAGGRPIKAPAEHEPVIPHGCTHVIGIIGMDAYGQPMNDTHVHRLECFLEITRGAQGRQIDREALKKLIGSPKGLFKNVPSSASRILLLNKCTDDQLKHVADALISECLEKGIGELAWGVRL